MLSYIADIADLIAAFAIVVSLLFVAYELRTTRKQTELTNWRELLHTLTEYKGMATNPDLAAILVKGHADYHALNESEKIAFEMYLEQGVHVFGNFLKHNDSLPTKLVGLEDAIANYFYEMLATPGGAVWWEDIQRRKRFMPDTFVVTNALLEKRRKNDGNPV